MKRGASGSSFFVSYFNVCRLDVVMNNRGMIMGDFSFNAYSNREYIAASDWKERRSVLLNMVLRLWYT